MSLGAGAYKVGGAGQQSGMGKEVSMATLQVPTTTGTVTLNPVSRLPILTKPNTYQREGGEGKRLENKAIKQASKCKANHEAPPTESSKVAPEPQQEATADWHCFYFNLA